MTKQHINQLRQQLLKGGVSWKHVKRITRELENHFDDLVARKLAIGLHADTARHMAEAELGSPEELAKEMVGRPELQSIGSRYPKLIFLALPPVIYIATGVLLILAFIATMDGYFDCSVECVEPTGWVKNAVETFRLFIMHAMAPILSCIFLAWGMRQQIRKRWLYSGIFLANLVACSLYINIQWPDPAAGLTEGSLGATIGYGFYNFRGVMDTKFRLIITLIMLGAIGWLYRKTLIRE